MRFLVALAWRTDRRRLLCACTLMFIGYLSTPFLGVILKGLTNAALAGAAGVALGFGLGAALLLVFELMMGHFAHLYYFELGEKMGAGLDAELTGLVNGRAGLEHFDDPAFHDTMTLARQDILQTRQGLEGVLHLSGLLLRASVTTVILTWVNPWLALLPVAAVPAVLIARRAQHLINSAKESHAEQIRLTAHLVKLAASSDAVKEVRVFGAAPFLLRRQETSWGQTSQALWRSHRRGAALRSAGQLLFAFAYGSAILLVLRQAIAGTASIGDVVLVITLAVQISVQVSGALGLMGTLAAARRTAQRFAFLRDYPAAPRPSARSCASGRCDTRISDKKAAIRPRSRGLEIERVSFGYPGGEIVLHDISLTIPAGSVVAVVGENGAGKSTLVKLLCGLYQPTSGTITPWLPRERVALLFQDFAKLQLLLRENVGVGDLSHVDDDAALSDAAAQANAGAITQQVGWDGLVGRDYGDGVELSGGQWQSLGLARALMRREPLLLALDEPAAALDAQAEYALFERFAGAAPPDAITLFVSHRFSTVRMAGLIVVLKDGRVAELGSHGELLERGGLYAELFRLQAKVYA